MITFRLVRCATLTIAVLAANLVLACPALTTDTVYLDWIGHDSGCTSFNGIPCEAGETISFGIGTLYGYSFGCQSHAFVWNYGDGASSSGLFDRDHTYSQPNTAYDMSVSIANISGEHVTLTKRITIGDPVPLIPVIDDFRVTPTQIVRGESVVLRWKTRGITTVSIDPLAYKSSFSSGTYSLRPQQNGVYVLTAQSPTGSAMASTEVQVREPVCVHPPSPVTIRWDCLISCAEGMPALFEAVTSDESTEECPVNFDWQIERSTSTGKFVVHTFEDCGSIGASLQVSNGVGTVHANAIVPHVVCGTGNGSINSLGASPSRIRAGQKAVLYWVFQGVRGISIQPIGYETDASQGTLQVTPLKTTTYTFTGFSGPSMLTGSVTVTVEPVHRRAVGH